MFRTLIFLCLFFSLSNARSQVILNLVAKNHNEKCEDFYVSEVSDLGKQQGALGEVFKINQQKENVQFKNGIEKTVINYLKAGFRQNQKGVPLHIQVNECYITETLKSNGRIKGEMRFAISAFSVRENKLSKIGDAHSKSSYERSPETGFEEQLSEEMAKMIDNAFIFVIRNIEKNRSVIEAFVKDSYVEILPFYNEQNPDTIYYQTRKINWNDFKAEIHYGSRFGAAIFTNFSIETDITVKNQQLIARVRPKVFMDKNMSWAKSNAKTDEGLRHEQLHFDITYLIVLEYLEKIRDFKAETADDLSSMIQYEYLEFYRKMNKMQEQYDTESQHSLNRGKQQEWENKVGQAIKMRL